MVPLQLTGFELADIINHPECVMPIRNFTESELAICNNVGAKYIAREKDSAYVTLHVSKPRYISELGIYNYEVGYIGSLDSSLFPSVKSGGIICVEKAQRDGCN